MIFASRRRRGYDRYLPWKVRALWLGGALALLGMWLESGWLLGPATVVLLAGILLRFLPAPEGARGGEGTNSGGGAEALDGWGARHSSRTAGTATGDGPGASKG